MLTIDYSSATGWQKPQILPYGSLKIPVSATSLHYGISCYEGLNVLKSEKTGAAQAFRPEDTLNQFLDSTNHVDLPLFDPNELLNCIKHLVKIDKSWFPDLEDRGQLYARINHFSTDPMLGVRTPNFSKITAVLSPCALRSHNMSVKCSHNVNKNWPLGHG